MFSNKIIHVGHHLKEVSNEKEFQKQVVGYPLFLPVLVHRHFITTFLPPSKLGKWPSLAMAGHFDYLLYMSSVP